MSTLKAFSIHHAVHLHIITRIPWKKRCVKVKEVIWWAPVVLFINYTKLRLPNYNTASVSKLSL